MCVVVGVGCCCCCVLWLFVVVCCCGSCGVCCCGSCGVCCCFVVVVVVRVGGVVVGLVRRTPNRRTAQNFAFFSPSPTIIFILSFLSWGLSLNFGGVFEFRDPQMSRLGSRAVVCFGASGGFTRQPENAKRANLRVPALQTTKGPPREEEKQKSVAGEGKKKERQFWGPILANPILANPFGSGVCHGGAPKGGGPEGWGGAER